VVAADYDVGLEQLERTLDVGLERAGAAEDQGA
jgi:hypothetical protein